MHKPEPKRTGTHCPASSLEHTCSAPQRKAAPSSQCSASPHAWPAVSRGRPRRHDSLCPNPAATQCSLSCPTPCLAISDYLYGSTLPRYVCMQCTRHTHPYLYMQKQINLPSCCFTTYQVWRITRSVLPIGSTIPDQFPDSVETGGGYIALA